MARGPYLCGVLPPGGTKGQHSINHVWGLHPSVLCLNPMLCKSDGPGRAVKYRLCRQTVSLQCSVKNVLVSLSQTLWGTCLCKLFSLIISDSVCQWEQVGVVHVCNSTI